MAAAIETAITPAEQAALVNWALGAAAGPLVEIGAGYGASTVMLAAVARHRGTCLLSIDHHRGDEHAGRRPTAQTYLDNVAGVRDVVLPVVASTRTLWRFRHLLQPAAGFVFVDGYHALDAVLDDVRLARHLLTNGDGRLVFHDYGRFEVAEAVEAAGLEVVELVETMALCDVEVAT